MDWLRKMARKADERFGQQPTDAALIRASVQVAKRHEDELLAALSEDLGYRRRQPEP